MIYYGLWNNWWLQNLIQAQPPKIAISCCSQPPQDLAVWLKLIELSEVTQNNSNATKLNAAQECPTIRENILNNSLCVSSNSDERNYSTNTLQFPFGNCGSGPQLTAARLAVDEIVSMYFINMVNSVEWSTEYHSWSEMSLTEVLLWAGITINKIILHNLFFV